MGTKLITQQLTAFLINLLIFVKKHLFSAPEANCQLVIHRKLSVEHINCAFAFLQEKTE